jgi:DNA repair protein RadC
MDYTIKDLPESERPREKLEEHGASQLTDVELLSIILRTGTQGKNVKELSSEILNSLSLDELASRELEELKKFEGVSRVKAGQLQAVGELSRRMKKSEKEVVESLGDVKSICGDMKFLEGEVLRVFYLSSGNELLEKRVFWRCVERRRRAQRDIQDSAELQRRCDDTRPQPSIGRGGRHERRCRSDPGTCGTRR